MKLFYQLFGFILVGIIVLHSIEEYVGVESEIDQYEKDMIDNAIQDGKSLAGIFTHIWQHFGEEEAMHVIEDKDISKNVRVRWVWIDTIANQHNLQPEQLEKLQTLSTGEVITLEIKEKGTEPKLITYIPLNAIKQTRLGALEMSQAMLPFYEFSAKRFWHALLSSIWLAMVCGLILYLFIHIKIRTPLNLLMQQINRIGQGDLSVRLRFKAKDELTNLANTMNEMCASLENANEKIRIENEEKVKTVEQLRHSDRLSTFGQISAGIAHEIGTPLNVIDGRAKMITSEDLQPDEIHKCANIIRDQSQKITRTIRQMLDYARRPKQHKEEQDMRFLVRQVFQLLSTIAEKQKVSFNLNCSPQVQTRFLADGLQIQQVLTNLLLNSIHAMPGGGQVSVTLANEIMQTLGSEEQPNSSWLKIMIIDEGKGIKKEDLKHIFTPFFTTKNIGEGTGLGLSIAHGIIKEHGGWIDVESNRNQGTRFSIYLPQEVTEG